MWGCPLNSDHDRGVRKFRGMLHTQWLLFVGALLFARKGWSQDIFEILVWGLFGAFGMFAVPNVAEKIIQRFPSKTKPVTEEKK